MREGKKEGRTNKNDEIRKDENNKEIEEQLQKGTKEQRKKEGKT